MNSFYSEEELETIGFKNYGFNVKISRKTSIYGASSISIGNNVRIDDFCILSGSITLGSHIHISAYCALYGAMGIKLNDYSGLSPRTTIFSAMDDFSGNYLIGPIHDEYKTNVTGGIVNICKFVQIGAGCFIFPNLTINEGSVIGAMSLVNKSLDSWGIYAGVPCNRIKDRSKKLLELEKKMEKELYIMEDSSPLVSIVCITYNHEPYIRECLDGFMMQKTNFKFEVLINDDASTDKTADIIREYEAKYPDIIKSIYQTENQYSKGVHPWFDILFPIAKGKYIAICEGDDYWIDPLKLQKQVDFLKAHPNLSLCFHANQCLYSYGTIIEIHRYKEDVSNCSIKDIILGGGGFMATNSMLFVKKYINEIPKWIINAPVGDLPLMLLLITKGDCCYINDIMSVYRVGSIGSWSSTMKNKDNNKTHHYKILKMWDDFDIWTNLKYHKFVAKKKNINRYNYAKGCIIRLLKRI